MILNLFEKQGTSPLQNVIIVVLIGGIFNKKNRLIPELYAIQKWDMLFVFANGCVIFFYTQVAGPSLISEVRVVEREGLDVITCS